jgi:hypothetical protein
LAGFGQTKSKDLTYSVAETEIQREKFAQATPLPDPDIRLPCGLSMKTTRLKAMVGAAVSFIIIVNAYLVFRAAARLFDSLACTVGESIARVRSQANARKEMQGHASARKEIRFSLRHSQLRVPGINA